MWRELSKGKKAGVVVAGVIALGGISNAISPAEDGDSEAATTSVTTTVTEGEATAADGGAATTVAAAATVSSTSTTTTTSAPVTTTTTTTTTTTAAPVAVISEGVYIVGSEIQPGVYRYVGYFARLDDDLDIIDNDLVTGDGLGLMEVFATDTFVEIGSEAISVADFPTVDPIVAGYTDGTYLVGVDIEPGRYRVTPLAGDSAYWARLSEGRDILDNDLGDGQLIAVIKSTDWAFEFSSATLEKIG